MGMSQEEIDRLMSEVSDGNTVSATSAQGITMEERARVCLRICSLYADSVRNIIPILIGESKFSIESGGFISGIFSEVMEPRAASSVFFKVLIPNLSKSPIIGWMDKDSALSVARRMMGQDEGGELDEVMLSALNEAFNNMLGAWDSALKDEFRQAVEHTDYKVLEGDLGSSMKAETGISPSAQICLVPMKLSIDDKPGETGLLFAISGLADIYSKHPSAKNEPKVKQPSNIPEQPSAPLNGSDLPGKVPLTSRATPLEVPLARFEELTPHRTVGDPKGIDLILDVPLNVTVELGRRKLSVKEILELVPGSLVELDKLAGENVDLFVNGKLFARGEVVVVDENFGVRVSSIVTPKERIERLR
jgi:flagellar motor switch protein FliN